MTRASQVFGGGRPLPIITQGQDYTASRYYPATIPGMATSFSVGSAANNTIYYLPFFCRFQHTFTGLSFSNDTSVNTFKFRLGIYSSTGGIPSTLVVDSGELTVGDASTNTLRTITISQSLNGGTLYWLAYIGNTSSAVLKLGAAPNQNIVQEVGFTAATAVGTTTAFSAISESYAYAALPSTATPGALVDTSSTVVPVLYLKG